MDPQSWWRLWREMARLRPDLVQAWGPAANAWGLAAAKTCGVSRFVCRQGAAPARTVLGHAVDRWIARRSDAVVVPGPAARDAQIACGLPAGKIHVIPDGVAPRAAVGTRADWLARLGLGERSLLIGLFGPLREAQRVKDAIWAADLLKVIRDDVHLLVFGDGPHRERLLRFRGQVHIRDKVHFLGQRSDALDVLPHLDVFWSASASGESSGGILAAMASGLPVVATDVPPTRELVVPGETGYLVRVGDRAGLARWTQQLLESPDLARRLGEAGRRRALGEFSAEKMARRYAALYDELLM